LSFGKIQNRDFSESRCVRIFAKRRKNSVAVHAAENPFHLGNYLFPKPLGLFDNLNVSDDFSESFLRAFGVPRIAHVFRYGLKKQLNFVDVCSIITA